MGVVWVMGGSTRGCWSAVQTGRQRQQRQQQQQQKLVVLPPLINTTTRPPPTPPTGWGLHPAGHQAHERPLHPAGEGLAAGSPRQVRLGLGFWLGTGGLGASAGGKGCVGSPGRGGVYPGHRHNTADNVPPPRQHPTRQLTAPPCAPAPPIQSNPTQPNPLQVRGVQPGVWPRHHLWPQDGRPHRVHPHVDAPDQVGSARLGRRRRGWLGPAAADWFGWLLEGEGQGRKRRRSGWRESQPAALAPRLCSAQTLNPQSQSATLTPTPPHPQPAAGSTIWSPPPAARRRTSSTPPRTPATGCEVPSRGAHCEEKIAVLGCWAVVGRWGCAEPLSGCFIASLRGVLWAECCIYMRPPWDGLAFFCAGIHFCVYVWATVLFACSLRPTIEPLVWRQLERESQSLAADGCGVLQDGQQSSQGTGLSQHHQQP